MKNNQELKQTVQDRLRIKNSTFVVDLNYPLQTSQIECEESTFEVPTMVGWWLASRKEKNRHPKKEGESMLLKKTYKPKGEYVCKVDIKNQNGIELSSDRDLITCKIGNNHGRQVSFLIDENEKTSYALTFDPSAIVGCKDTLNEDRIYPIAFDLKVTNKNGSEVLLIAGEIKIVLKKIDSKLSFEYMPGETKVKYYVPLKKKVKYEEQKSTEDAYVPVGKLLVSHNSSFLQAPKIKNQSFSIFTELTTEEGIISPMVWLLERECNNGANKSSSMASGDIVSLLPGQSQLYNIYWNMSMVENPPKDQEYNFIAKSGNNIYKYGENNNDLSETDDALILLRDELLTEFSLLLNVPQNCGKDKVIQLRDCDPEEVLNLTLIDEHIMKWPVSFRNEASSNDNKKAYSGVMLWNIQLSSIECKVNGCGLIMKEGYGLDSLVKLNPKGQYSTGAMYLLKARDSIDFDLIFDGKTIEEMIPHEEENTTYVRLELCLEYNLYEHKDGDEKKYNEVKSIMSPKKSGASNAYTHKRLITVDLKKSAIDEWLCVDFGTSAIVASTATEVNDMTEVDLRSIKNKVMMELYEEPLTSEDEEKPLISSDVCLHKLPEGEFVDLLKYCSYKDLPKYPFWFSPSESRIERIYQLPCLKSVMGYGTLPLNMASDWNDIKYTYGGKELSLVDEKNNEATPLMNVNTIFNLTYTQLFNTYVGQKLTDSGKLEKRKIQNLVLSVPNTYSPLDIQNVVDLARKAMKGIYPENLRIISESDAVACYYLWKHREFEAKLNNEVRQKLAKKENVLIYDMGAGTLDLTYFTKTVESGKTTVKIHGKMGISKAGNYMDYALAQILKDLILKQGRDKDNDDTNMSENESFVKKMEHILSFDKKECKAYDIDMKDQAIIKKYVKELKKKLDRPEATVVDIELLGRNINMGSIKVKDFICNPLFTQYLTDVTEDVIGNFAKLYGHGDKLAVDVVVFSGRSTALNHIRYNVKGALEKYNSNGFVYFADICGSELSEKVEMSNNNHNMLKTVVSYGALAHAILYDNPKSGYKFEQNPVYANYGIVLHCADNNFKWVPLIIGSQVSSDDARTGIIPSLSVEPIDPDKIYKLELIQTYSADVVSDYRNKKFESISKLGVWKKNKLPSELFTVSLTLRDQTKFQSETSLDFKFGALNIPLDPHEDFDNDSLRKSLWPVTFSLNDKNN